MPHFRSATAHPRNTATPADAALDAAPPAPGADDMHAHYAAVCAVLWSERELLGSLACTVVVERLVRHAGAARRAADDVKQDSLHRLGLQEVLRSAIVDALLTALGAPADTTLRDLAAAAPEPWATMLAEHRESLAALSRDLESLADLKQLSLQDFLG